MDKRILSRSELHQLKQFIISRSSRFAEPVVLLEILDHFACKTEELLVAEPGMSFEEAMRKAHQSFGIKGFAPIAAACEQSLRLKYRRMFRKEQGRLLFSWHTPGIAMAGMLCAQLILLLNQYHLLPVGGQQFILCLDLAFFAIMIGQRFSGKRWKRHKLFFEVTGTVPGRVFGIVWLCAYFAPLNKALNPPALAWAAGLIVTLLLFATIAHGRMMRKMNVEMDEADRNLELTT